MVFFSLCLSGYALGVGSGKQRVYLYTSGSDGKAQRWTVTKEEGDNGLITVTTEISTGKDESEPRVITYVMQPTDEEGHYIVRMASTGEQHTVTLFPGGVIDVGTSGIFLGAPPLINSEGTPVLPVFQMFGSAPEPMGAGLIHSAGFLSQAQGASPSPATFNIQISNNGELDSIADASGTGFLLSIAPIEETTPPNEEEKELEESTDGGVLSKPKYPVKDDDVPDTEEESEDEEDDTSDVKKDKKDDDRKDGGGAGGSAGTSGGNSGSDNSHSDTTKDGGGRDTSGKEEGGQNHGSSQHQPNTDSDALALKAPGENRTFTDAERVVHFIKAPNGQKHVIEQFITGSAVQGAQELPPAMAVK